MAHDDPTPKNLANALRAHLSPHAIALIAARLQETYGSPGKPPSDALLDAEQQCQWFTALLIEMIGAEQYKAMTDELGL